MRALKYIVVAASVTLAANTAFAGGFLADTFIRPFNPDLADAADRANAALGNPVDHAVAAGADVIVPGTGQALELGWQLQHMRNRMGSADVSRLPQAPQHVTSPAPVQFPQQVGFPAPQFPQQVGFPNQMPFPQLGQHCATPIGVFGPGMPLPLGAPCNINGQVFGQIVP